MYIFEWQTMNGMDVSRLGWL